MAQPTSVTVTDPVQRQQLEARFPGPSDTRYFNREVFRPYAIVNSPLGVTFFLWRDLAQPSLDRGWICSCSARSRRSRACRHVQIVTGDSAKQAGSLRAERAVATRYGKREPEYVPYIQILDTAPVLEQMPMGGGDGGFIQREVSIRSAQIYEMIEGLEPLQRRSVVEALNWFQRAFTQQMNDLSAATRERDNTKAMLKDFMVVTEPGPQQEATAVSAGTRRVKVQEVANG